MTKYLISSLVAGVALMVTAGCGGSDPSAGAAEGSYTVGNKTYTVEASTTMTTASFSRAQFIDRINEICQRSWVTIRHNFVQYSGWQDSQRSQRERFAEAVRLSLLAGIDFHIFDEIHLLGAPQGEKQQVEEMIGAMQLGVERGEKLQIYSADQIVALFDGFNRRAGQYGLGACLVDKSHLAGIAT